MASKQQMKYVRSTSIENMYHIISYKLRYKLNDKNVIIIINIKHFYHSSKRYDDEILTLDIIVNCILKIFMMNNGHELKSVTESYENKFSMSHKMSQYAHQLDRNDFHNALKQISFLILSNFWQWNIKVESIEYILSIIYGKLLISIWLILSNLSRWSLQIKM